MPVYKFNGDTYNIPQEKQQEFEKEFPDASISYMNGADQYDIPVGKKEDFLKDFPNAKLYDMQGSIPQKDGVLLPEINQEPNPTLEEPKTSRGFMAGVREGWKGLSAGIQNLWGEGANLFTRSSQEDANALYTLDEMLRQGKNVQEEVQDAWTTAGRELRTGAMEFLPGWMIKGWKNKVQDEAARQKILSDIRNVLTETGGDVAKARELLTERAQDYTYGDRQIQAAAERFAGINPTEGVGAWIGSNAVQMIPSASALIVAALTKSPAAARAIGGIGMGTMTAATAGSSMYEARQAGANDYKTWKTGVVDGAIEYITEQLPFDRYTKRLFGKAKSEVTKEFAEAVASKNSPARKELEELLIKANERLGGRLFSKRNLNDYMTDILAEGASEFSAEALQTMTSMMYEDRENYPTLGEIVGNGLQGALAGVFMGSVLGGASKTMEHVQNRARRKEQGYVDVAVVDFEGEPEVVEVVASEGDKAVVLKDGEPVTVDAGSIGQGYRFTYEEFENARMRQLEDEAVEGGTVTDGMIQAAEKRTASAKERFEIALDNSGLSDEVKAQLREEAERGVRIPTLPEVSEAMNDYINELQRGDTLTEARAEQIQQKKQAVRDELTAKTGGQFWKNNLSIYNENGPAVENQTVEFGTLTDGRKVYILSDVSGIGEAAAVTEDGQKLFVTNEMLPEGTQIMSIDDYLSQEVETRRAATEQERMASETASRIEETKASAQPGTQINLGTAEAPVLGQIIQQTADGVMVQTEAGVSQLTWEETANALGVGSAPMTDAEIVTAEASEIQDAESQWKETQAQSMQQEVLAQAENSEAIRDMEDSQPLPVKADGSVDQTALWNQSPERWARWNDEQRQDGGANSINYINNALTKAQKDLDQVIKAYGKESDFDARTSLENDIKAKQERVARLTALQQSYIPEEAIEQAQQESVNPVEVVPVQEETQAQKAETNHEQPIDKVKQMIVELYNDSELTESEIEDYVNANVKQSQADLDKHVAKAPKMGTDMAKYKAEKAKHQEETRRLEDLRDFWNNVKMYIEIPTSEMDFEPQNALEFAANELTRRDGIKLLPDSFKKHTGYGGEAGNFLTILRTKAKGGMTLEEAGERLMEIDRENNTGFFDQSDANAGLNAVLDVISGARTSGDISGYIRANREQTAKEEVAMARNAMMEDIASESKITQPVKMSEEDAQAFIDAMKANAEAAIEVELTPENWIAEFGENGVLSTPVGDVKMGENQYLKLLQRKRSQYFGMIRPTLTNPDIILEEYSPSENGERNTKLLFVKTFIKPDGTRYVHFESVTILKDSKEISISSHEINEGDLKKKMHNDNVVHLRESLSVSEWPLNGHQKDGSDLVPSPSVIPSDNKDSDSVESTIESNEKVEEFVSSLEGDMPDFTSEIEQARAQVDTEPTEAQKEAGNYRKGHIRIDGYDITIENPKGSVRKGTDSKGNQWENTLNNDYGYIRGTEGVDGDHIDVYLSDNPAEGNVYVIDQINPDTQEFDEHKVMYGFNSAEEAREAYLANFSEGWNGLGVITEVSKDEFKKWIESSHRKTKPFSEYKSVKAAQQSSGTEISDEEATRGAIELFSPTGKEENKKDALRARVNEWEQKLGVPVKVMESIDDVTNTQAKKLIKKGGKVWGWYETGTNQVYIYLPDFASLDTEAGLSEIDKTYIHEIVSHQGLRGLLGEEKFGELCDRVWEEIMSEDDRRKYLAYPGVNGNQRAAADEYIAHFAETVELTEQERTIWDKIVDFINNLLGNPMTEEDLGDLIRSSYARLAKNAADEEADSSQKIEDFGEKIGGARKDVARAKIRNSVNLTGKDLKELKDPDKILSRKQIVKYFNEGQMTLEDAQTMLAANMAVRSADTSYKELALTKYRDMAVAWEKGEEFGFNLNESDIDMLYNRYDQKMKDKVPDLRDRVAKSLRVLLFKAYDDYRNTYEALKYPAEYRDLKSLVIQYSIVDTKYWVLSSANARRGTPRATMLEAVAYVKNNYPIMEGASKSGQDAGKSEGEKKETYGHLYVVKSRYGGYRIKSRVIPGDVFISGKDFYSKKTAEAYLKENAERLVERERTLEEALMGSNIGMVERKGEDYRQGKDVTPQDFLDTFGFRGVEFGNWVPQAERQMYLNKTYDAIMDLCNVIGISPRAFTLGGRLAIGFGSRGKSRAMAHYEPVLEVINLTRMHGAGSLAHEWFHALDNFLAKQKTGNTSDMITDVKDAVREEVVTAFRDFVKKMDSLPYTRRSRRAGEYWGEVWERAARLFENYVYNELGGKGMVSPLLVRKDALYEETAEDFGSGWWPYPSERENAEIKPYFDALFDALQEQVQEEGNVVLYRAKPEVDENVAGLETLVERIYRTTGAFSFSGSNAIESSDDVAYIFRQLEDSAVENSFLVFVKDGVPTILHTGMGNVSSTFIDNSVVLPAYKDYGADRVYMVHNHPSGTLRASQSDLNMLLDISNQLPGVSVEGIIIDTTSGEYGIFDLESERTNIKNMPESGGEAELTVLSFDRNVFSPDYKVNLNERKISNAEDVASFLSAHRLGEGSKVGALLLNIGNVINGNLITNENEVSMDNADVLARQIAEAANRTGSTSVILFGDFDYSTKAITQLKKQVAKASGKTVSMLDVVRLAGKHTQSMMEETLPYRSTLNDGVRFRITPEQDKAYMDAVEAGDMETAQRMVVEAARMAGYDSSSEYQGSIAFNGAAPSSNPYYESKEERKEAWENGDYEGDMSLGDYVDFGIDTHDIEWQLTHPNALRSASASGRTSILNLRNAVNSKDRKIKIYRAIDANIKEGSIRNGDWVTPSRSYAQEHIYMQSWKKGRIIEQEVSIDDLWWDGNDINEWGYDDGKGYAYKDTKNNRKLLSAVTYDDNGNVIPLSKRFNPRKEDVRFRASNENQAIFVSNAARAVEGIKMEKATPEQWLKMIENNGGLKAGEDKWMGLSDFLKASAKKTLTKQEVLDFINEHMIAIEEVHYIEGGEEIYEEAEEDTRYALQEIYDDYIAESEEMTDDMFMSTHYDYAIQKLAERLGYEAWNAPFVNFNATIKLDLDSDFAAAELNGIRERLGLPSIKVERAINETRLDYTTTGLYNKREIALTVPTIESWGENDKIHFGDAGDGRAVAWVRFGETKTYAKEYADFYAFQEKMQQKYFPDRRISALSDSDLDSLTAEEKAEFERLRNIARSIPMKERTRRRVLVIDEIQSKRHQEGRERGYISKKKERELREKFEKAKERFFALDKSLREKYGSDFANAESNDEYMEILSPEDYREYMNAQMDFIDARLEMNNPRYDAVPDAPFDKNWHELAMKRMLRYAAENGYDVVAWTKGDQQAERYNIGSYVSSIEMQEEYDGKRDFGFYMGDADEATTVTVDENGTVVSAEGHLSQAEGRPLADLVGKDMAVKMMQMEEYDVLEDTDLKVGNEGMKGFYDKMLPAFMNKYGKKWGVKVEDITLPNVEEAGRVMHSVPVTEDMKASVMEGQTMFRARGENESAMDFHQSVVNEHLNKYKDIAAMEVFPVDEATAKRFGYTLDELKKLSGLYDSSEDLIAIFAREDETDSVEVEDSIFHESVHKLVDYFDYLIEVGEWMWSVADKYKVFAAIKEQIEQEYSEDEYAEEMMCSMLGGVMSRGMTDDLLNGMPERIRKQCGQIFNEIGYDRTRESIARLLGQDDKSTMVSSVASETSRENEGRRRSEKELTTEERAIIREYFPTFGEEDDTKSATDNTGEFSPTDPDIRFRAVTDPVKIEELENGPKIKVYRAMQLIDGKLYPPMSAKVDGKLREPIKLGQWEEAEERPDLVDSKGNFKLDKANKSSVPARYNPYFHTSRTPLNDQFSSAQTRPNLVTVEVEIPESELTSGYKAQKAKDSVGEKEWKAGIIQGKLTGTRKVILSRWDKPVRIVPDSEVADRIVEMFEGRNITMPSNVVTPSLRTELEKRGVPFVETDNQGRPVEAPTLFRSTGTPTDEVVAKGLTISAQKYTELAGDIYEALPEDMRSEVVDETFRNGMDMQSAIFQIPTRLAETDNLSDKEVEMAKMIAGKLQDALLSDGAEMTRPLTTSEALWMLYRRNNTDDDILSVARRSVAADNLGFSDAVIGGRFSNEDDIRFRAGRQAQADSAAKLYNTETRSAWRRLQESWQDMNVSVDGLMRAIEKASGKTIQAFEDVAAALNRLASKNLADKKKFMLEKLQPLWLKVLEISDKFKMKIEDIERYMMLKHGLERNLVLAARDARNFYKDELDKALSRIDKDSSLSKSEKKAEKIKAEAEYNRHVQEIQNGTDSKYQENRKKDYGGLTALFSDYADYGTREDYDTEEEYQAAALAARTPKYKTLAETERAAESEVKVFENKVGGLTDELWKAVNAATKDTLKHQYNHGMLSKEQYESVRDMFKYYVPLRGFKDNTVEDMYSYYSSSQLGKFSKPLQAAKGRKTEAESPLGWIGSMAESAIQMDNKNDAKLRLYYLAVNRPDNDLLKITETWYEWTGERDADGKKIFEPVYPTFAGHLSGDAMQSRMDAFDSMMEQQAMLGNAFRGKQKLDIKGSVIRMPKTEPEHIVTVKVAGKDYSILINGNPRAAQAINGLLNIDKADDNAVYRGFRAALRLMSSLSTSYNPEFWISNFQRDIMFAFLGTSIRNDAAYTKEFAKNYAKAFKVVSMLRKNKAGKLGNSEIENYYREFSENGGITGFTVFVNNTEYDKMLREFAKDQQKSDFVKKLKGGFEAFADFGEAIEQVSRFAAYMTARKMGKGIEESVNEAKEVTVNFNRKGSGKAISWEESAQLRDRKGKPLNWAERAFFVMASGLSPIGRSMYMFFNASIQGLRTGVKLAKENPKKSAVWAGIFLTMGMLNAVLHAMLDDDDDYLDMPDYEKRTNLLVGGNGVYFKWALPQEVRPFYAMADIFVNHALGRSPHKNITEELAGVFADLLPVNAVGAEGLEGTVGALMPSYLSPIYELIVNKDFKGSPIYREMPWIPEQQQKYIPGYTKAYGSTGGLYVDVSEMFNNLSGGTYAKAGRININPAAVEHIIEGYGGGTLTTANKLLKSLGMIAGTEEVTVRRMPFLSRLLTINDERYRNAHTTELFNYYKGISDQAKREYDSYKKQKDSKNITNLLQSEEWKVHQIFVRYQKMLEYYDKQLKLASTEEERRMFMQEQDAQRKRVIKEISELR